MKSHSCFLVLLLLAMEYKFTEGQSSVTLTLTSPIDVTSGNTICPNTEVELSCIAVSVTALAWRRNGMDIDAFNVLSALGTFERDPFITFLDVNTGDPANMNSRLVFNASDVMSGDTIDCITNRGGRTITLSYQTKTPPGELQPNDYVINIISRLNFNISWNPLFTSQYNVTFYRANITQSSIARCPAVCVPFESCQCTMPAVGEVARISVSATNCGDQEGPAIVLEAQARLPSPPSECWGLPVYNYKSNLTGIYFQWTKVNDPPEFKTGVHQDITHYSVSMRGNSVTVQIIPATTACPTVNCSYLIPLNVAIKFSSFRADVSANNVIGPGPSCPIRMEADSRNQVFTLHISSTNPTNQTVECTPQTGTIGMFDCEFCYNPLSSCRSTTFSSCQVITESLSLSSLNEMTYCYQATARINGTSVAMIQGNFSTGCLPQDLGIDQPSNLSSGTFPIFGGRVSYNGTTEGAVATYQCDGGYSLSGNVERVCQSDGNWNGQVPQCTEAVGISREAVVAVTAVICSTFFFVLGGVCGMLCLYFILKYKRSNFNEENGVVTSNDPDRTNSHQIDLSENVAYGQI